MMIIMMIKMMVMLMIMMTEKHRSTISWYLYSCDDQFDHDGDNGYDDYGIVVPSNTIAENIDHNDHDHD